MVATPIISFLIPPETRRESAGGKVLVGTISDIPVGQGKVVAVGQRPTIVVNTEQGVKAYSATCTHLGCIVAWDAGSGTIVCPCHDGRFDVSNGAVVSGPPPSGLPAAQTSVEGDQIFVIDA
jgi:cytochrome b6-f complex iron-sulfur subunit